MHWELPSLSVFSDTVTNCCFPEIKGTLCKCKQIPFCFQSYCITRANYVCPSALLNMNKSFSTFYFYFFIHLFGKHDDTTPQQNDSALSTFTKKKKKKQKQTLLTSILCPSLCGVRMPQSLVWNIYWQAVLSLAFIFIDKIKGRFTLRTITMTVTTNDCRSN